MWIRQILFFAFCFIAGTGIAAGYVAFITLIGVFDKLTEQCKFGKHTRHIETLIILGVTIFNLIFLLNLNLNIGYAGYAALNLMGGIFVGCLVGALAETINIFPIISRRFNIRKFLPYVIIGSAVGKAVGCMVQLLFLS